MFERRFGKSELSRVEDEEIDLADLAIEIPALEDPALQARHESFIARSLGVLRTSPNLYNKVMVTANGITLAGALVSHLESGHNQVSIVASLIGFSFALMQTLCDKLRSRKKHVDASVYT